MWHAVTRYMETHYYHVTVELDGGDRRGRYVLMLDDERLLQRALVTQSNDAYVKSIQVVTPGHMNGSGDWKMEPLECAQVGQDIHGCSVSVLTVDSGLVYHTSRDETFDMSSLSGRTLIFQSCMIRPNVG